MVSFSTIVAAGAALLAVVGGAPIGGVRRDVHEVNTYYHAPKTVTVTVDRYVAQLPGGGYTTLTAPPSYSSASHSSASYSSSSSSSGSYSSDDWQQQMLTLVNQIRAEVGKPALTIDSRLNSMAQAQSNYQASVATMTHDNPAGSLGSRCSDVGVQWRGVAENVAWNYPDVPSVVKGWKNSPGHYANMIGDYNIVGFAVNDKYWTQDFASV
ncbi:hypothetical protein GGI25_001678 [Coemansia spiralis]|uniref:SCP domain-containing protein n=2 Tax=Coemansia TaxID=4863 RepID=A0A9W8G5S3_9FUNG|nr:CAP domain-containing protein [Coemansia spiralis]KAJ1989310.1 hypothetical protein EDC05_004760 [Coemansia umbellata]KAJ2623891.1 hypothetical protein GGI26_001905 [Coemansia sp. RSA 1358]KAJ2679321.1 hypothetical protein GGI25_001678 [Coemansia spiralis]